MRRRPTAVFAYSSDADGTSVVAERQGGKRLWCRNFSQMQRNGCGKLGQTAPNSTNSGDKAKVAGSSDRESPATMTSVATVIRDFKPGDFDTLWRMDQECFPPGISYSKQELRAFMRHSGSFTLLAVDPESDRVDGFIIGHAANNGGSKGANNRMSGHIVTIDVSPNERRSGVGSLLLEAAEERLRSGGCRAVALETAVDNVGALSFYKRHGYSVTRTWPRYYANGVDALVLKKELVSSGK
jgi:ribosomal-protein-alanine N-acetyltransferase